VERFIEIALVCRNGLDERTVTKDGNQLPALIRREKLDDCVVLVFGAEAGNCLSAVDVKNPHRDAVLSGNAREKARQRFAEIVIINGKFAAGVKRISRLFIIR
jgi:hypothetical protein